jgi:hypothetical protein
MIPHLEVTESAMRRLIGDNYDKLILCCVNGSVIDDAAVDAFEGSAPAPEAGPEGGCY